MVEVRNLLEEFRRTAYEMGLRMQVDAAEAAFSPSEARTDRTPTAAQRTTRAECADGESRRAGTSPARALA